MTTNGDEYNRQYNVGGLYYDSIESALSALIYETQCTSSVTGILLA